MGASFTQFPSPSGLAQAVRVIESTYGDTVSIEQKAKSLLKFGQNTSLGTTQETIWLRGGHETYPTTNAIDTVSSDDNGDTQSIVVEGHTISNGELTFVSQSVTLTGQTKATLSTPMARANRMYNNGNTDFAGTVYVYEDDTVVGGVPQTLANIHLQSEGANNQSLKAATSLSNLDYWIITQWDAFVNERTTAAVDFAIQTREVGTTNKVFRSRVTGTAASTGPSVNILFDPPMIIPKNHDVRVVGTASTANVSCESFINGYLAIVV